MTLEKNEINILEIIQIIWKDKLKIFAFSILFLIITFFYTYFQGPQNFNATTNIKPVSHLELEKYKLIKDLKIFDFKGNDLVNAFINKLENKKIFKEGIVKLNLINKEDYKDKFSFEQAVVKLSNTIEFSKPLKLIETKNKDYFNFAMIHIKYFDEEKWIKFLDYVYKKANEEVRQSFNRRFEQLIFSLEQQRKFKSKDIDLEIERVKKQINHKISNLEEQALIARLIGVDIGKNIDKFSLDYMQGYLVIEKKIEIIKNRKNVINRDKKIIELQNDLMKHNKYIEEAKISFKNSPFSDSKAFKSVVLLPENTKFKTNNIKQLLLILSFIIGSIIGIFYVLIINMYRKN